MYEVKMIFVLIQVGSHLWVNPMQLQGIGLGGAAGAGCETAIILATEGDPWCSDWPIDRVRKALASAAVSKAMEGK